MSQINFFMLIEDIIEFTEFVLEKAAIFPGRVWSTPRPFQLKMARELVSYRDATIIDRDLSLIYPPEMCKGGSWMHALYKSPAIEFLLPYQHEDGRLISGRIYAKIGWLASETDNRVFKASYSRLERWIKKRYQKVQGGWWASPRVLAWSSAGGVVAFGGPLALSKTLDEEDYSS